MLPAHRSPLRCAGFLFYPLQLQQFISAHAPANIDLPTALQLANFDYICRLKRYRPPALRMEAASPEVMLSLSKHSEGIQRIARPQQSEGNAQRN